MLLSFNIDPAQVEEHDRWHTHEHLPERLSIPGFLRGTRWVAVAGEPRYMVLYEVRDLQTLTSEAYLKRLNNPSPWTRRIMPSYRNMSRGLCSVLGSFGYGQGGAAAMVRISLEGDAAAEFKARLLDELLPAVPEMAGLGSAHFLQGAQAAPMTNEQRMRGMDEGVEAAIVVTGYRAAAVEGWAEALCSGGSTATQGVRSLQYTVYSMNYSLSSAEIDA